MIGAAITATLLGACKPDPKVLMYEYRSMEGKRLDRRDTLVFDLPEITRTGVYALSIGVRLGNTYPYGEMWLGMEGILHNPDTMVRDTMRIATITPGGMPRGTGLALRQFETDTLATRLHKGQTGTVRLFHIMACETVPEVLDIGIKISQP